MHILPVAGSASRFNGLPKYLLPGTLDGKSLLIMHIEAAIKSGIEKVVVMSHSSMFDYLVDYLNPFEGSVIVDKISSKTMTETIVGAAKRWGNPQEIISFTLPDTSFDSLITGAFQTEISKVRAQENSLLLFPYVEKYRGKLGQVDYDQSLGYVKSISDKNPQCDFPFIWGGAALEYEHLVRFDIKETTIGNCISGALSAGLVVRATMSQGRYFDCGNMKDYREYLLQFPPQFD